ncbi:MAG: transglutaminase domain-containing protein, partial [Acidimicrobiia bacterium]|nr:transglutaminase domain-containing protein [Acidimicrobiia bacterium]
MNAVAGDRRLLADLAATLGLAVYSAVAALGFARVFAGWSFATHLIVIVVVGHGMSLLVRYVRIPAALGVALVVIALAWTVARLNYPETFTPLFPTGDTWTIARADLGLVRTQFRDAVAPVVFLGGWSLLASVGTAIAVLLGDTFAFRAHARGEALVPAGVLFVFVGAVGASRHRVGLTLALVATGFLAAALLRVRFSRAPRTILGRARHPVWVTLPAAGAAGTLVVLGAWAVGPNLPGADEPAIVDTRGRNGGVTEVVNPLVDIRSRLVKRTDTVLFSVRASTASYWRVTALPRFDGRTWDLPERPLESADGELAEAPPGATVNEQRIRIRALRGELVPAAADPVAVSTRSADLSWGEDTSTLVTTDGELATGDLFEIRSAMPTYDAGTLRAATTAAPPDAVYLELPDDFPGSVRQQALEVTSGQPTSYDRVKALQDWFRTEFDYSLEVQQGHGNSAIEAFLRQRVGYCEQFAGTFAAMARSLGIPARVAVGFTPGLIQTGGTRDVLGKNAHAWPEVWFDGVGWVPFEPTPGRGRPGGEQYTGVAPAQDDSPVEPGQGGVGTPGGPAGPGGID